MGRVSLGRVSLRGVSLWRIKRRRGGSELLAYRNGRRWVDVRSDEINEYIKELTDEDFSAKDFRTWSATVIAAVGLWLAWVVISLARIITSFGALLLARRRAVGLW